MAKVNWDLLSYEDLKADTEGRYDDMSEDALRYVTGEGWGTGEALLSNMSQGITSSLRGLAGLLPENDFITIDKEADLENERRARMMLETNPIAGWAGLISGSIFDPVTLPAAVLKPLNWTLKGALGGATGGALDPTYSEFGDSKVMNILAGAGLGAGLGYGLGKLFGRFGKAGEAEKDATKILNSEDPLKAVDETVSADGVAAKLETETPTPAAPKIPENATFNPQTKQFEIEEEVPSTVNFNLPRTLSGAKPRFNQFSPVFANDLDKALYIIGKGATKSASHAAYVDWVKGVTGLSDAEVSALARTTRDELVKKLGVGEVSDNKIAVDASSTSARIIETASAPKKVAKAIKPEVTIKDGLDEEDLNLLSRAGVKVVTNRDGTINFRDTSKPNQPFISNGEFMARMEAAGIAIDLPAYRARTKAEVTAAQESEAAAMGRGAGDQPEITPQSQQFWSGIPPVNKEQWTAPKAPETDRAALEAIGAPVEPKSVGARGVSPARQYGGDLMPGIDSLPPTEMMNRLTSMSVQDVIKMLPPKVQAEMAAQHPKGLVGYMEDGLQYLKVIQKRHGNIVEWMVKRSKNNKALEPKEVGAFAPFYWHAFNSRIAALDKALDHRAAGGSWVDSEGAKLSRDLQYYTGVMLFKQQQGSKAGRSLNAYNLLSEKIRNNKTVQNMFPGVLC